jgi:hypothetical protein
MEHWQRMTRFMVRRAEWRFHCSFSGRIGEVVAAEIDKKHILRPYAPTNFKLYALAPSTAYPSTNFVRMISD